MNGKVTSYRSLVAIVAIQVVLLNAAAWYSLPYLIVTLPISALAVWSVWFLKHSGGS